MYPVDGQEAYDLGLYDGPTGTMIDGLDEEDGEPEEVEFGDNVEAWYEHNMCERGY